MALLSITGLNIYLKILHMLKYLNSYKYFDSDEVFDLTVIQLKQEEIVRLQYT